MRERDTHTHTTASIINSALLQSDVHTTKQLVRLLEFRIQQDMLIYILLRHLSEIMQKKQKKQWDHRR